MQRFRSHAPAGVLLPLFVLALATLGAASVLAACADTPTPSPSSTPTPTPRPSAPADWPTFTDPDGRFSLRYPSNWHRSDGEIYSFDPSTATGSPGTYPSGVEIETHVFESAGRGFCGGALKLDASGALDSIDAEATATTLGGQPAWELVRDDPDPPATRIHGISLLREGNCILLIAYYTEETPDEQTFAQIADSFEILSPTPYPQSTITIQFVQAGEPASVWQAITGLTADGVPCVVSMPGSAEPAAEYVTQWPLYPEAPQPPECSKGPPTTLVFLFAGEFGFVGTEFIWSGGDGTVPLEFPSTSPVIHEVESNRSPAYEHSFLTISGAYLRSRDGDCSVEVSGLRSYVQDCGWSEIQAWVPWNASSGDVVVTSDGVSSNAVYIEIVPFEEGSEADLAPGIISLKMLPGADIGPILEEEGEPPDAAELVSNDDFGWYTVSVPEGEELAKSRAYSMHPEVLIVEPSFIRLLVSPIPAELPIGGGLPNANPAPNALYTIAGAALLAVSAAVAFSQRPSANRG